MFCVECIEFSFVVVVIAEIIVSILGTLSPLFSVWYSSFADSCVFCEWKCFDFEKGACWVAWSVWSL